jgi:hypothetical protein
MKFEFKDGTIIWGKVYNDYFHKVNREGLTIEIGNKIYLHHYPAYKKITAIDYRSGTYTIKEESNEYAPPISHAPLSRNPWSVPNCVPTRINFIHFKRSTLKDLYNSYSKVNSKEAKSITKAIVLAYNKKTIMPKDRAHPYKTKEYEKRVEVFLGPIIEFGNLIPNGQDLIWGKDYSLNKNPHPYKNGYYKK